MVEETQRSKPDHSRHRSADDNLAIENYQEINRAYYAAEPADYFEQRLNNLLLAAGNPEGRAELLRVGGEFGELKFGETTGEPPPDIGIDSKAVEHFVLAEAEVLAHHVGETLLRLYLAHEKLPGCPALELGRVLNPRDFKRMVRLRFLDSNYDDHAYREPVSMLFHHVADPSHVSPNPGAERWWASVDNIELFLRHFGSAFLEDANLYNSAKHGMALTPTEFGFKFGDSEVTKHHGPAIYNLEQHRDSQGGRSRWFSTYHWVTTDRQVAITFMGIALIRSLWSVARTRYTETDPGGAEIRFFDEPRFDQVVSTGDERGVEWTELSIGLLYWKEPEAESTETGSRSADFQAVSSPEW